jgi:hypothetical protein
MHAADVAFMSLVASLLLVQAMGLDVEGFELQVQQYQAHCGAGRGAIAVQLLLLL